jgi:aminopeptidase-like protein
MSKAYEIVKALAPLSRQFASPDYDASIHFLEKELPFQTHVYGTEHEHNGWVLPPKYEVKKALIKKGGLLIYDGLEHPLRVPCHASSFHGIVNGDTLKQHLWFDHRFPEAIPYHFRYSYRPWERDWGFCVPKTFYDSISNDLYEIELEILDGEKELKVLEYTLLGSSGIEFAFIAHLDHPGMANDDLAGCAVGVEFFQDLRKHKLRHTYRLLIVQEIIGSEMHLHANPSWRGVQEGLFMEMLGVDVPFVIQRANSSPTAMEMALKESLSARDIKFTEVPFRESAKNDEIVFEAYGIPTAALVRFPYAEYHCSRDNISIINKDRLHEAVEVLRAVAAWHEEDLYVQKLFGGVACFSNPKYGAYVDPGQPALGGQLKGVALHQFMERIALISGPCSTKVLSSLCGVPFDSARRYLEHCAEKGLVRLI